MASFIFGEPFTIIFPKLLCYLIYFSYLADTNE